MISMFTIRIYEELDEEHIEKASFAIEDVKNVGKVIRAVTEIAIEEFDPKPLTTTSTAFRTTP